MATKAGKKKRASRPKMKGDTGAAETPASPVSIPAAQVASADQMREAMDRVVAAAKKQDDAAKGATSTKLNFGKALTEAVKVTGFEKDAVAWYVKNRDRDPEDIDRETRERNKVATFMNMAIGGQLGLLENGDSVASQTPKEQNAKADNDAQSLAAAEAQGHQAGSDGASFNTCEYPPGSKRRDRWQTGWQLAQKERAKEMSGPKAATHQPAHA